MDERLATDLQDATSVMGAFLANRAAVSGLPPEE